MVPKWSPLLLPVALLTLASGAARAQDGFTEAERVLMEDAARAPAASRAARAQARKRPAPPSAQAPQARRKLSEQLGTVRGRIIELEESLVEGSRSQKQAKAGARKIQKLIQLQREERVLGRQRMTELEKTIAELETRKKVLGERILQQRSSVRRFLMAIDSSNQGFSAAKVSPVHLPAQERLEAPRRKALSNLADRGLKEIEVLKIDLADADRLEQQIEQERQQLAYLFEDLREQESVMELNRQLQQDILTKRRHERVSQLENYRKLKSAESQLERLLEDFNARLELERASEAEKAAARGMGEGMFAQLKGRLPLPVAQGRIVSSFGRGFDPKSRLQIFRKGVDVAYGSSAEPVRAVSAGKVAFSGELPDYGRVAIVDHGDHFYTLCARLGSLTRKAGDSVTAGDVIGSTDGAGTPVYFEIRARNIAVNPLQWVSN